MAVHGQQDIPSPATVTAGRPTQGDVLLASKRDTSVAAVAGLDVDLGLVIEHGEQKDTANGGDVKGCVSAHSKCKAPTIQEMAGARVGRLTSVGHSRPAAATSSRSIGGRDRDALRYAIFAYAEG